jgi:anhydro-N-acetylmuramic acid kinase
MNPNIQHLFDVARKPERQILGLMSGTSLDGLDIAWCTFSGSGRETKVQLRAFKTMPFEDDFRAKIRSIFARQTIEFQRLTLLNPVIAEVHAALILATLKSWKITPADIDLIASHGQTVFHAPKILHGQAGWPNATLQIGDGDHLAVRTGILTLSDFRQKHIAAGGEGAPLALYGDFLLFSNPLQNRVLVNLGGIANFTWLPKTEDANQVFATDTGPGNTLMDGVARDFFQKEMDENGEIAASGMVNSALLAALLANDYFQKTVPKTTGPELFSQNFIKKAQKKSRTKTISPQDLMATLAKFSAQTLADAIQKAANLHHTPIDSLHIYLSGGGAHNPVLLRYLQAQLPDCQYFMMSKLGIDGDAKEAVLFATLANEALAGTKMTSFGLNGQPGVAMGKVSFPK